MTLVHLIDRATGKPPVLHPGDSLTFDALTVADGPTVVVIPDGMTDHAEPVTLCDVTRAVQS